MDSQKENASSADYLAPGIGELRRRGGQRRNDSVRASRSASGNISQSVARRLLPACVVVPAVLWWALYVGQGKGWFDLETSLVLFVFSVAAVFGLIVCLDLKRLAKIDSQRAETEEQLKLAKESAEAANRFKSAFFAN